MLILFSFISVFVIQLSSAQILSLGMPNNQFGVPLQNVNNIQRSVNFPANNVVVGNTGISGIGVNSLQLNSAQNLQIPRNLPVAGTVVNGNFGNGNLIANVPNNFAVGGVSSNLVNTNFGTNYVSKNIGSNYVNANTPINLANGFNINTGTFAVGNTGLASLLPNGRPCGIQIAADALEVAGAVGVNGQLPFYTTVNVNGNLPSSGVGYVNCGCGQ